MLYAKVVLGLPVEGPFDYSVPSPLHKRIREGVRVWIQFRDKRKLGYVVKLTSESSIEHVKPILEIIDDSPILDKNMLLLTKELSDYYGCSWGEAIETAIPEGLRKGKKGDGSIFPTSFPRKRESDARFRGHDRKIEPSPSFRLSNLQLKIRPSQDK